MRGIEARVEKLETANRPALPQLPLAFCTIEANDTPAQIVEKRICAVDAKERELGRTFTASERQRYMADRPGPNGEVPPMVVYRVVTVEDDVRGA